MISAHFLQEAQLSETGFDLMRAEIDQLRSANAELVAKLETAAREHKEKLQHLTIAASKDKEAQRLAHRLQESEAARERTHRHFVEMQGKHAELQARHDELVTRMRAEGGSKSELETRVR